jgi:hypothetical protein
MPLIGPDGARLEVEPSAGPGKPEWRVGPDALGLIEGEGLEPRAIETPVERFLLEPGGDYVILAKELYMRMLTELAVYKDHEKRALAWMVRRQRRRQERDRRS